MVFDITIVLKMYANVGCGSPFRCPINCVMILDTIDMISDRHFWEMSGLSPGSPMNPANLGW